MCCTCSAVLFWLSLRFPLPLCLTQSLEFLHEQIPCTVRFHHSQGFSLPGDEAILFLQGFLKITRCVYKLILELFLFLLLGDPCFCPCSGKEEYMEYMSNIIWGYYLEIIFYPKPQCQGGGKQCLGNSDDARCSASPGTAGEELCFIHFSWKSGVPRGFGAGCSCGVQTDPRLLLLAGTSVNCFSRFLGFQLGWEPSSRWETILKAHRWCFGTH